MGWEVYRWVWRLEGPLHLGLAPAGMLNRTRLYVPARTLLGALTAELTRRRALATGQAPSPQDYEKESGDLKERVRLTYLFPAQETGGRWLAWLPQYREGKGLVWQREDGQRSATDREFRRWLLTAHVGTAIDPYNDSALEGSLREHEVIQPWSRWGEDREPQRVFLVGFVFLRPGESRLKRVVELALGGDTRYGLGWIRRVACNPHSGPELFRDVGVDTQGEAPLCRSRFLLAHGIGPSGKPQAGELRGALEAFGGWNAGKLQETQIAWEPGSSSREPLAWRIQPDGLWEKEPVQGEVK